MELHFGTPKHGWMSVRVGDSELDVSDVPCDSLYGLVKIMERLLSGSLSETVEWSLEPEYAEWIFERCDDEIAFSLKTNSQSAPLLVERGAKLQIIDQIIDALSQLEREKCWVSDTELRTWSWPFPALELSRLKSQRQNTP